MSVSHGAAVWCMDYDKERHQWQCLRSQSLSHVVARAPTVRLLVPSQLTMVDGGRHGYLVANGELTVDGDVITIKGRNQQQGKAEPADDECRQRLGQPANTSRAAVEAAADAISADSIGRTHAD